MPMSLRSRPDYIDKKIKVKRWHGDCFICEMSGQNNGSQYNFGRFALAKIAVESFFTIAIY